MANHSVLISTRVWPVYATEPEISLYHSSTLQSIYGEIKP